jgi:hypothetical protein
MAFSKTTLTLFKWLYWVLGLAVHLYICYMLFTKGRAITGILYGILGLMLLWLMYPVYFPPGDPGSQWPPYIRSCPDYLTQLYPDGCVDYGHLNSPLLKPSDPANPPKRGDSQFVFDSSGSVKQKAARAQQFGLSWEGIN